MIDALEAASKRLAAINRENQEAGINGFLALCRSLGLDAGRFDAFVAKEAKKLPRDVTSEEALLCGLLIGTAAAKTISDEAATAPVFLDSDGDLDWAAIGMVLAPHHVRTRILRHLQEVGTASPNELTKALDLTLSNVSYHVAVLAGKNPGASAVMKRSPLIKQVRTEPRRGAVEHYYSLAAAAKRKD